LFYGFNLKSPKVADARFREAIVRAIDRRAVVAAVYQGTARAGDSVVVEGVPGHQPRACRRCAHDPGRARQLLTEAFPGGVGVPEVGLDYDADPTQEGIARSIQAGLAGVGIKATLRPRPVDGYDDFLVSDEPELFRLGWVAAFPSPEAFLSPMFRLGSGNNLTGLADKEVDALLLSARAEPDAARRTALYQEAERAILDAVPVIPIAQFEVHAVVSKRVRGLTATSLGTFDASTVSLKGSP
jgi:oligopeptide transport system substrate-binding protein